MSIQHQTLEQQARPLAEELIAYALRNGKKHGVTDVEITISKSDNLELAVEKRVLVDSQSGIEQGINITLFAGARSISFSTNSFDKDALKQSIDENAKVLRYVPENPYGVLLDSADVYHGSVPDLDLFDGTDVDVKDMVQYATDIEIAALAQPEVKGTRSTSFKRTLSEDFVMATNGVVLFIRGTSYSASIEAIAERDGKMQADGEYARVVHFSDLPEPELIGESAAATVIARLGSTTPKTMKDVPVVLDRNAASRYFSILYNAMDGENVYKGTTFFKDKLGEQVVSAEINLLDNPHVVRGLESQVRDSAGLQSRPIQFIENGILREYNSNLEESRKLNRSPIGRQDGSTNIIIQAGPRSPYELMKDIKTGVYIRGFNGGKADVNTGKHSREAYGHMIRNGEITTIPVSGFAVSGDLREMFNNTFLANDTPPMPNVQTSSVAPTTRINGLTIAGR